MKISFLGLGVFVAYMLIGFSDGCTDFWFASNFSFSETVRRGWRYREVSLGSWNVTNSWSGANYASLEVNPVYTADLIAGACYLSSNHCPMSYIAHVYAEKDFAYHNKSLGWATTTDFGEKTAYVAHAFLFLEEIDKKGKIVAVQSLQAAFPNSSADGLLYTSSTTKTDELQYVTFSGAASESHLQISISYLASPVTGILNQAQAKVGPKSFGSVIQIQNWPYRSSENSLVLYMSIGTSKNSHVADSKRTILIAEGATQVYFSGSTKAQVGTEFRDVKIDITTNTLAGSENPYLVAQLDAIYGERATYHTVGVTFPHGASNIVYNTEIGVGAPMGDPDASSAQKPGIFGNLLSFLKGLF